MEINKSKTVTFNVNFGIQILRMILCFWVIVFHFGGYKIKKKYKIINSFLHVPTFMIISFYFSSKLYSPKNISKIKLRLEKLLIPFLIIPIIKFGIIILFKPKIKIKKLFIDLLLQYITGYKIIICLWFIHILIIFIIFFEIIYLLFKKRYLFILHIVSIISYWFQYSEINYNIFIKYKRHLRSVSHFFEMMPIAVTGLTLGYINIMKQLINYRMKSIFFSIVILSFIYNYNICGEFRAFYYSGIKKNIAALSLFFSFYLIPLEKINKIIFLKIIREISNYTGGIYYFHPIISNVLSKISFLRYSKIITCFMIYIIGYFICLLGTKIFRKTKFKYLFN